MREMCCWVEDFKRDALLWAFEHDLVVRIEQAIRANEVFHSSAMIALNKIVACSITWGYAVADAHLQMRY